MEREAGRATPQMDVEARFWVRVLLLDDVKNCTIKIPSAFSVIDHQTGTTLIEFDRSDAPIDISVRGSDIIIAAQRFGAEQILLKPNSPHIFNINGNDYRGNLKLTANAAENCIDVINLVPLEPYLAGVVGAEMPDYWEPAALMAQAIAARTYCLYTKKRFGSNRNWDVRKTQANQVYKGIDAESANVWKAVKNTNGQVLICKKSKAGPEFPAYYSSTCGGHTENSTNVFGGEFFAPLAGVECPYCVDVAKTSFYFWPMTQFDESEVQARLSAKYPQLKKLGKIKSIVPTEQSSYDNGKINRLTKIKLTGSNGQSDFLRAEDLRLTIDPTGNKIKSTICKILKIDDKWVFVSGRGYGHGVGMCQCGAQALAKKGKSAEQILSYYYPSSKTVYVY